MATATPKSAAKAPVWDAPAAAHLLSRAAFGATPREIARLTAMPLPKAVDTLLDEAAAAPMPPRPGWVKDVWTNEMLFPRDQPPPPQDKLDEVFYRWFAEIDELRAWWFNEMVTTPGPLREVMTLFWHGHFTSATDKAYISQVMYEQNTTLRRHALGNVRALVGAITIDPAMMIYLDLEDSDKARANENYARELLELFTMGVGSYTETDIKEVARALTGWTLQAPPGTPKQAKDDPTLDRLYTREGLVPTFVPGRHDTGPKTIFGRTASFGTDPVLDWIVEQPAAGLFVAGKLIEFFGAADPKGTLRTRLAAVFVKEKYEIRPVLRALLTSPEFYAPASRGSLIKGPVALLAGAWRQLELEGRPTPALTRMTAAMGQELFYPPNVKGWPGARFWIGAGTLAVRYHVADALLDGKIPAGLTPPGPSRFTVFPRDPGPRREMIARYLADEAKQRKSDLDVRFDPAKLFPQGPPSEPPALVDALLRRLVVTKVRPTTRAGLVEACKAVPAAARTMLGVRLVLASPEYQMA